MCRIEKNRNKNDSIPFIGYFYDEFGRPITVPPKKIVLFPKQVGKNPYQKREERILAIICINLDLREYLKGVDLTIFSTPFIKSLTEYVLNSNESVINLENWIATEYTELLQKDVLLQKEVFLHDLNKLADRPQISQLLEKIKLYEEAGNEIELEKAMNELDRKRKRKPRYF